MEAQPFFARFRQPTRGVIATILTLVIALLVIGIPLYLWKPWPVYAQLVAMGMGDLNNVVQLGLYMGAGLFAWIFWWSFHMMNWPFQKVPQPWQGLLVGAGSLLGGYVTYHILHYVLGWDADIFNISVLWLMWVFILGPWTGLPILTAYGARQPISGISGFIASLGLALLSWWLIPEQFRGYVPGFPFIWFLIVTWFALVWEFWPIQIKQPQQIIVFLGYLAFFSFIVMWVFSRYGLNFFPTIAAARAGAPPPIDAGTFTLLWLLVILFPVGLFQFWPLHRIPNVPRGFIFLIVSLLISIGLWAWIGTYEPTAKVAALAPLVHFRWMYIFLDWTLALFVGWAIVWVNCGLVTAPPPGAPEAPAHS